MYKAKIEVMLIFKASLTFFFINFYFLVGAASYQKPEIDYGIISYIRLYCTSPPLHSCIFRINIFPLSLNIIVKFI